MSSVLHLFLQSVSAILFVGFILQLSFMSQSSLYLRLIGWIHSCTPLAYFLLFNKLFAIILLVLLTVLFVIRSLVMSPSYLKNASSLVYFALGFALMGFTKLTLGELTPFTLGFLEKDKKMVGTSAVTDHNPIRIRDYSTMYGSPNGYFYYLVLLANLVSVRVFSKTKRAGDLIETSLPSRTQIPHPEPVKRRRSIDESEIIPDPSESVNSEIKDTPSQIGSRRTDPLDGGRKFELFEKDFSVESPENLSQADSQTSNVKSSSSQMFLEKFAKLRRPSSIVTVLLRLRANPLSVEKSRPLLVLFWAMTYSNFRRLVSALLAYFGLSLFLSGNAFLSDLLFAFLLAKVFARFYFRVLERYF